MGHNNSSEGQAGIDPRSQPDMKGGTEDSGSQQKTPPGCVKYIDNYEMISIDDCCVLLNNPIPYDTHIPLIGNTSQDFHNGIKRF